jgi:hypothetical protein
MGGKTIDDNVEGIWKLVVFPRHYLAICLEGMQKLYTNRSVAGISPEI